MKANTHGMGRSRLPTSRPEGDELAEEQRVWQIVHSIPKGRVSTYGVVAALSGFPRRARWVGQIMSQLPAASKLPWHRVVNAAGRISIRSGGEVEQRKRLRGEGVRFRGERIDLKTYLWPDDATNKPRSKSRAQTTGNRISARSQSSGAGSAKTSP